MPYQMYFNGNDILFSHCSPTPPPTPYVCWYMPSSISTTLWKHTTNYLIEIMPVDHPITHRKKKKHDDFSKTFLSASNSIENVSDYRINYSKPFEICTSHLRQAHFMQCKNFKHFSAIVNTHTRAHIWHSGYGCRRFLLDVALILILTFFCIRNHNRIRNSVLFSVFWNCFIWFIWCTIFR